MNKRKVFTWLGLLLALVLSVSACTSSKHTKQQSDNAKARKAAVTNNSSFVAPVIHNFVEYNNYVKKYKLDDTPSNILWCTTSWGTTNAPLVTIPIAGKLTSSSVSLFPSSQVKDFYQDDGTYNPELPQADGMYHGNPPAYRYGFTPSGQYVDFTGMQVLCTTALTKFQKDRTQVDVAYDTASAAGQSAAEKALAQCQANAASGKSATPDSRCEAAQKALLGAVGNK